MVFRLSDSKDMHPFQPYTTLFSSVRRKIDKFTFVFAQAVRRLSKNSTYDIELKLQTVYVVYVDRMNIFESKYLQFYNFSMAPDNIVCDYGFSFFCVFFLSQ